MKGNSVPFGEQLQRRRAALVSWLALAVAVGGVITYAVQADGYQAHRADLNDGGIWVTSKHDGSYGRINKPIGELDGTVFSRLDSNLDVVQDGDSVVGINLSDGVVVPLDPAQMKVPDGEEAPIPGSPVVGMAGGSLAVLDASSGDLWAVREDPETGVPTVAGVADQIDPLAEVGEDAALAVALDGTVFAASSTEDRLLTLRQEGDTGFLEATTADLPGDAFSDAIALTTVGAVPVVLDSASGRLVVIGGGEADVPRGSILQQPGPSASAVLVGARDALLSVDLATGEVTTVAGDVGGDPAAPVRLGDCVYGAWAGGTGAVVTACGGEAGTPQALDAATSDLVFRTNRGQIVLNDRETGRVWDIDSDKPTRLDNWDAFNLESKDDEEDEDDQRQNQGDRRPPKAMKDNLGARPGRTTILHPLDNDSAPSGRLLAIRTVRSTDDSGAQLAISPDGPTVQITLPGDAAGSTSFEYFIDDGRQSVLAHATVRVAITSRGQANSEPRLRLGFEPRTWTVPSGGTIDVPVLPDWRDPRDGDPVSTVSAALVGGGAASGDSRVTASGAVRFHAPRQGGQVQVEYGVSDGLGPPVMQTLDFRVQQPGDNEPVAPTAEPDVIAGETGKPIEIRPLANDLPGADSFTPEAVLTLAGKVGNVPGAEVTTNLAKGTITLRSETAQTYFLDYQAAYGSAETDTGKIRVDVRAPESPPLDPVAVPDTVTLFGQAGSLVDVLANDVDPSGGLLSVQRAEALAENQLDVAIVNGRWLRLSARQGQLTPNPQIVRYTISNGYQSGIAGQVVVSQRPAPADDTPVTQNDEVTVREGSTQAISVLDNDFSPSGGALSLVAGGAERSGRLDVQHGGPGDGDTGAAFVSGRTVRYVAPVGVSAPTQFTIRYEATNERGATAAGKVRVRVLPIRLRTNNPPEPPVVEGRTVSGDTVKLRLPGYGVDPDGDAVTILGLGSAPELGLVTRIGANSIEYTAYPGSVGTDEFSYQITDTLGATSTGIARVSIAPPGPPQPPLAVPDAMTVAPGRTAVVDVVANDLVAAGSRVTVSLVAPPPGVRLRSETGPIEVDAPRTVDGRSVEVVYRLTDGLESTQTTLTLNTQAGYNNPPVVSDAFGAVGDGGSVTADVLSAGPVVDGAVSGSSSGAYDPDGPFEDLVVTDVYGPEGIATRIVGGQVTVERAEQPMVVAFRVEDADGGAATGSLYVPAADSGLPFVEPDARIELKPGQRLEATLADYVTNPSGGPLSFTLKSRMWPSPDTKLNASVTGNGTFTVRADARYAGPGAVVAEVTTGASVDDPAGIRAILSIPVQVGETRPILRCPEDPIEVSQAESVRIDIGALCHVWTAEPSQVADIAWSAEFDDDSASGLTAGPADGGVVEVTASAGTEPGSTGTLRVAGDNSNPGRVNIRVVRTAPPSLAPIRVSTLRAGESQTIDLARYLTPGVSDPVPTVVAANQLSNLPVQISSSGSSVTIRASAQANGQATFRVVMSDVAGDSSAARRVEGRIQVDILGVPDAPGVPVWDGETRDSKVGLDWKAPQTNGAPIDYYEVQDQSGRTQRCQGTSCDITGLQNGNTYKFHVRAHNPIGFSEWSGWSAGVIPDKPIDMTGRIKLVSAGDGVLSIKWNPVVLKGGGEAVYTVRSSSGVTQTVYTSEASFTGLDNHLSYTFRVRLKNAFTIGAGLQSEPFQPIGTPTTPAPPTLTDQESAGSTGAVSLTWPAVDPNGPGPVRYTVLRNGSAMASCTNITTRGCDNSSLTYDGTVYSYAVVATNDNGKGVSTAPGPATQWRATGKPASWGGWTVAPTGSNNQARASFDVPPSRGSESVVRIYVDSTKVLQVSAIGKSEQLFDVPNNLTSHSVVLEVCNEEAACTQSAAQPVQTWGPLVAANIHRLTPTIDVKRVAWTIEVDSNGDDATVTVTSDQGRNETFAVPVGVSTITTQVMEFDYQTTETLTVTMSDSSPARGPVTATNSATTEPPPAPTLTLIKGAACNDDEALGLPKCNTNDLPGADCKDPSCAVLNIDLQNFTRGDIFCSFDNSPYFYGPFNQNGVTPTNFYFGKAGQELTGRCVNATESAEAPPLVW
ncbi:MAG: Ig-like domain-containing protein [Nocardioides sp.]